MRKKKKNRYIVVLNREYTYKDKTQNGHKWIKQLQITAGTFARRISQYGVNDERTFYTIDEMTSYVKKYKKERAKERTLVENKRPKETKTYKWKQDKEKLCKPLIKYKKNSLTLQARIDLITALIEDAKDNLLPKKNGGKSIYFDESKRWLLNGNGGLEYLLEYVPRINVKESLKKLKEYAEQFE